jgi:hypothetical protein
MLKLGYAFFPKSEPICFLLLLEYDQIVITIKFVHFWGKKRIGNFNNFLKNPRYPVEFAYMLCGTVLDRVNSIYDLRVIIGQKMNFLEHIDVMVGKTFAMLGFIRRLSFEFRDPYIIGSSEAVVCQLCIEPSL